MRRPRIAIPVPHSDREYANRSLPQYERAIEMADGQPVRIPLDAAVGDTNKLVESCDAVLLPGSKADVDPAKYAAPRHPKTADDDPRRYAIDASLLEHAFKTRQPILGICYGLQSLNVYCKGTLIQQIESTVNHAAGRNVAVAHEVAIDSDSKLARILGMRNGVLIPVNSSHHQAAEETGKGLHAIARCPHDGIIEALEGTSPEHFVVAVQWHPERSVDQDETSRAIFEALVAAARERQAG
jgi:putative glutamine amidotransferase